MGKNSSHAWAITKAGPEPLLHRDRIAYPDHRRAQQTYSQWMSGFGEDEIARFFEIEIEEVLRDVQHVHQILPVRTVIAHLNDRNRILIQRAEGERYRRLLSESLSTPVEDYLQAGVSPVGALKEYREAAGMVEKPGTFSVSVAQSITIADGRPTSAEDVIRKIVAIAAQEKQQAIAAPEERELNLPVGPNEHS
jgi:hypothetical protein